MDVIKEISKRAKEVDKHLMSYLQEGDDQKLMTAVRHYPEAGGKRLRPIIAMVVAEAVGKEGKKAIPFGCSLEIIHNFTLVHDDVMDEDSIRRGRPAVHVLFDIPTAIIAGDALFARAFEVLAETDVPPKQTKRLFKLTAQTVWLIAEGQQMDIDFESTDPSKISVDLYLEMIEKKTAVLFACAAEGGAIIADGSERQIEDMREYARLLGLGFQIWDDVLGITGKEETLGKPIGSDIRNGKRTLIVLRALEQVKGKDKKKLLSILGNAEASEEEIKAAIEILDKSGSIEYAKQIALDYADLAKERLECLEESKEKEFLKALVEFAVGREH